MPLEGGEQGRDVSVRRSQGTGSLYVKRGRAGKEAWHGRFWVHGKRVKRRIGPKRAVGMSQGLTQRQAERELQRLIERENRARPVESVTVGLAGERYLAHLESLGRRRSTLMDYESCLRVHLVPFLADKALGRIEEDDVEAFEAVLQAVPDDHLGATDHALYLTAAMSGLRQGELLALRWRDIDWSARKIRVRRNYVRGEYGKPKSKRSSRAVPLATRLARELEHHSQRSRYQTDDDLVFGHPELGSPLDRSMVRKRFRRALREAGARPDLRFHDLRHTFGTRMAAAGVSLRTLQEWMGHRDIKTTQIYADYQPGPGEGELVDRAFHQKSLDENESDGRSGQGMGAAMRGAGGDARVSGDPLAE